MDFMNDLITEETRRRFAHVNSNGNSYRKDTNTSIAIEEDKLVDHYSDLIHTDYRTWAIKRLKSIGRDRFIECAEKARKYGNDKQRMFAYLIK